MHPLRLLSRFPTLQPRSLFSPCIPSSAPGIPFQKCLTRYFPYYHPRPTQTKLYSTPRLPPRPSSISQNLSLLPCIPRLPPRPSRSPQNLRPLPCVPRAPLAPYRVLYTQCTRRSRGRPFPSIISSPRIHLPSITVLGLKDSSPVICTYSMMP